MSADPVGYGVLAPARSRGIARGDLVRWHLPLLLALCGLLYFSGLGLRPLWDKDEGMHAATARVMLETGDWLTPYFNGQPFYDKPPLFTWLVALSFWLLGFGELAARLPAALCGTGGVVLTYLLGRRIGGPSLGFIAALVLASCLAWVVLSIVVVHDIALGCAVLLAALGLWECAQAQDGAGSRGAWLFWLGSALAILAKGPVGLLPIALAVLLCAATRRLDLVRTLRVGRGALVLGVVAAPWYVAMALQHPDYLRVFVLERVLGSFGATAAEAQYHHRPLYYYVPVLLGAIFPWTAYLPAALRAGIRAALSDRDAAARFLLLWIGAPFAVFTLAESKLASYVLPLVPPVALLVGGVWRDALRAGVAPRELWIPKLALVAVFAALVLGVGLRPPERWLSGEIEASDVLLPAGVLLAGQALAAGLLLGGRLRATLAAEVGTVAALLLVFTFATAPKLESHRSSKQLAARLERWFPPGAPIAVYGRIVGVGDAALFYSGRREAQIFKEAENLRVYLSSPEPVFCVLSEEHLPLVSALDFRVVDRVGTRLIISNVRAP